MAEAVEDERWAHIRGVTVTTIASVVGIIAGIIAGHVTTAPDDVVGVAILAIAIFVQLPVYKAIGIEVDTFGIKDYLFVMFMTFCFWFVTWAIVLTTDAEIPI